MTKNIQQSLPLKPLNAMKWLDIQGVEMFKMEASEAGVYDCLCLY